MGWRRFAVTANHITWPRGEVQTHCRGCLESKFERVPLAVKHLIFLLINVKMWFEQVHRFAQWAQGSISSLLLFLS